MFVNWFCFVAESAHFKGILFIFPVSSPESKHSMPSWFYGLVLSTLFSGVSLWFWKCRVTWMLEMEKALFKLYLTYSAHQSWIGISQTLFSINSIKKGYIALKQLMVAYASLHKNQRENSNMALSGFFTHAPTHCSNK